jgi:hypothetical protein
MRHHPSIKNSQHKTIKDIWLENVNDNCPIWMDFFKHMTEEEKKMYYYWTEFLDRTPPLWMICPRPEFMK